MKAARITFRKCKTPPWHLKRYDGHRAGVRVATIQETIHGVWIWCTEDLPGHSRAATLGKAKAAIIAYFSTPKPN